MSIETFVRRRVGTTLLTLGLVLAGALAYRLLPVSPLPQVDFPTISVQASLPGASPETMAATVATPLERTLGRIAGVTEITSSSSLGSTRVTLQFDLSRNIDSAARDVQAGINAARALLPTGLPSNPTWRKVNPADAPIMILSLTSETLDQAQVYDTAATVLAQKLAQVEGVGQVTVGGGALPAVRVEIDLPRLAALGIGLEEVRSAIVAANPNRPKGIIDDGTRQWIVQANDQARTAAEYAPLVIAWKNGAPVRLSDVAEVVDSVQDLRNAGQVDGRPAVQLLLTRQPGANIVETVERVQALLPQLRTLVPSNVTLSVVMERTATIRGSLREVQRALVLSIALVVLVVFAFLRDVRATLVPAVAVPASLAGTLAVMWLAGYSLDNLSLMALTVATGFVVDDAIVVVENVQRRLEAGASALVAAIEGTREVAFTVVSMSLSLVAVFIPVLAMGGIVGRLFREFAVTLSVAVLVSMVVSLTTTPAMCAALLRRKPRVQAAASDRVAAAGPATAALDDFRLSPEETRGAFGRVLRGYRRSLAVALAHPWAVMMVLAATIALNVTLYAEVPKGFFPQQDNGVMIGIIRADQGISFQAMRDKLDELAGIVRADPAVEHVAAFTGGGQRNGGFMYVTLKPRGQRDASVDQVIGRLRPRLSRVPGANLFLQAGQDLRVGGRQGSAQYQYTLQADDLESLRTWEPRVRAALSRLPQLADVDTDLQERGLSTLLDIDRDAAARLGVPVRAIDAALNDAFGQRQVSTIYRPLNQYRVVMEAAPRWWQSPESLASLYVLSGSGTLVPLSALAQWAPARAALSVNHQGQFPAVTISFNLPAGGSLSEASRAIDQAMRDIGVPSTVQGGFQGTARTFQASLSNQPVLIAAALATIYIVLGILYESTVHPITILSTLPSAGVGALLALLATGTEFGVITLIGVVLLIGIVKKNAIMMVDFAIDAQRRLGLAPRDAILQACLLRLRPILMTTAAALLGALPLALGTGDGAELRRPLGISIVGGLLVSQLLTLYTTPVVYLLLDRLGARRRRVQRGSAVPASPRPAASGEAT